MEHSPENSSLNVRGLSRHLAGLRPLIRKALRVCLEHHGAGAYAVSITFVDDATMASLNRRALGRQGTTDVIAFDLSEDGLVHQTVGDIYISLAQARRQSAAYGVSLREEVLRLAVHGLLHTMGYRDDTPSRRRKMESCVERVLRQTLGPAARGSARGGR